MNDENMHHGAIVWVKSGEYKGHKGVITALGFGSATILTGSTYKTFVLSNLTTKDPNAHTVPLPPNFIPSDYEEGDLVEVTGYSPVYDGMTGKVIQKPIATSFRSGDERRYEVQITDTGKRSAGWMGSSLYFAPEHLKKADAESVRVEGAEIGHAEVQIGDTIRTVIESEDGSYKQVSSKEGKVKRVTKRIGLAQRNDHPAFVYAFANERNHALTFEHRDEKITLVKAAENPYKAIVEALAAGSVVVRENENGTISTYVKSVDWHTSSQWHVVSSLSSKSSTFVSDEDVIRILSTTDAEIVHKVRK